MDDIYEFLKWVSDRIEANPATATLIGTIVVAIISAYAVFSSAKKDRRRKLYADAYRAAIEWREMFYRLRRRAPDDETGYKMVDDFHDLQQRIDFFSGWLGSISIALQGSYTRFVGGIKKETFNHIHHAWDEDPLKPGGRITSDEPQPNYEVITRLSDDFLKDVRRYQSALIFRRLSVIAYFYWIKCWKKSKFYIVKAWTWLRRCFKQMREKLQKKFKHKHNK